MHEGSDIKSNLVTKNISTVESFCSKLPFLLLKILEVLYYYSLYLQAEYSFIFINLLNFILT